MSLSSISRIALPLTAIALIGFATLPDFARAKTENNALTSSQQDAVKELVRQYILDNPSVIIEAVNNYKQQEEEKAEANAKKALNDYLPYFAKTNLPSAGNAKGDITVVEFFDYSCGYCKKAFTEISKLIEDDKNVRVVFIEMPILSEQSATASQWALAAQKQGKYFEFHKKLMEYAGPKTPDALKQFAKEVGLDVAQLEKDAGSDAVKAMIEENHKVATALGIEGTPGFVIGQDIVRGYLPYDALKEVIKMQREKKTK